MLSAFERMVAFRYLRARREEGMISVIALFSLAGIALGVMTLIVVLSVMNGVRSEMIKSIIGLEGHVTIYSNVGGGVSDYESLSQHIAQMPGVVSASPKIEGQVMITHRGRALGAMVSGYRDEDLNRKVIVREKLKSALPYEKEGTPEERLSQLEGSVVMGNRLAEKIGVESGDSITLVSPEGQATIAGMVPRMKAYNVAGMFEIGMFAYDSNLILMPFEEAQIYFRLPESASLVEVMLQNPDDSSRFARELATELGSNYRVYDWQRSNGQILNAVIVQRNVMFLILMMIILVACFNVISSLIMLVREKGGDIAILRTVGASRSSIQKIFILCGMSVGVIGTLIGVVCGLLIAFNTENIQAVIERATGRPLFAEGVYFLSNLPSKVEVPEVLAVVLMSLTLSFLSTLYPSWKAAKMNPAEALKYE